MEDSKHKDLIISHLEDNIRDKDLVTLLDWLDEAPANRKFFFRIKDIWDSKRLGDIHIIMPAVPLWKKAKLYEMPRWRTIAVHIGKYAAAIAIAVAITALLMMKQTTEVTRETVYRQVWVQNAKQSQPVVLSDGTRVWLNASSTLKYPESFESAQRNVWLDGEAYFEVAANAEYPFVVHTDMLDVKVLGTHFNLTAYSIDRKTIATLIEGKVELWTGDGEKIYAATLEPSQQAVYLKDENRTSLHTVDTGMFTAWKNGYYKFNNTSFAEIAEYIEKTYQVKITFTDESLRQIPYSGTFVQEQNIRELLEIMRSVKPFKYQIKENQVIIKK